MCELNNILYKCFIFINSVCFQSDINFIDTEKEATICFQDKELHFYKIQKLKDNFYICSRDDIGNSASWKYKYVKNTDGYVITIISIETDEEVLISNKDTICK